MENEPSALLLTFLNILADELQIEELKSIDEAPNLVPILLQLIKSGELTFVFNPLDEKFSNAIDYLKNTIGNNFVEQLNAENADKGDKIEIENMLLALVFALRLLQEKKFNEICRHLDSVNYERMTNMIERLDNIWNLNHQSPIPFSAILKSTTATGSATDLAKRNSLSSRNIKIYSSPDANNQKLISDDDATIYKVKAAELEAKLKQMEALSAKLNEQHSLTQTEYNDLENRHENLKHSQILKQETIDQLQIQLKETADEAETIRYQNSQLQRDIKSVHEKLSRETQKSMAEMKSRDEENKLLYLRLDELVKQLTEKESLENKMRFVEQQMANQQGIIKELRDNLEGAIERANIAESELRKQAKHENSYISAGNNESGANISQNRENSISLHEELNFTYQTAISHNGLFNNSHENNNIHHQSVDEDGEIAQLRTRLEIMQCENRQLKKMNEEYKNKLEENQSDESKSILEKAKEIERLKQEIESFRNEAQKKSRNEASALDKYKNIEEDNIRLKENVTKLEESLDKAAKVIEEYSNVAGEDHCSAAELLQLRHEFERVQTDNQRLLSKMDQFKHEAAQEQRLITQHWYQSQRDLLGTHHTLGLNSSTPSSMRSSLVDNLRSTTPIINNNQHLSPTPGGVDDPTSSSSRSLLQQPFSYAQSQHQQQKSLYQRMDATTNSSLPLRMMIYIPTISILILIFLWFADFSLVIEFGYDE